jgi:hypothetical protein
MNNIKDESKGITYDFQEGQIVELFHGVPADAWDIFSAPDDVLRKVIAWNDPNGDFDELERVHMLEIFLSDFIQSKRG